MTIAQIIGIIIIFIWLFLGTFGLILNDNVFSSKINWLFLIFMILAPFMAFLEKLF